jgi:hypothetical protein
MTTKYRLVAAGLACVLVGMIQAVTLAQRGNANSGIVGVWHASEIISTGPGAKKVTNPQPSVWIFTQRHFSIDAVTSDAPRPELPPQDKRTEKQVADAYGPFTGRAGTYEVKGSELTTKHVVAKNPARMKAGAFTTYTVRFEGKDTLWLAEKATDSGPVANPDTFKLTRLE